MKGLFWEESTNFKISDSNIKGLRMKIKNVSFLVTVILGIISAGCLVLSYQIGTEIWNGQGDRLMQWTMLRISLWPMAAFHVVFFINATILLSKWQKDSKRP
jgi:hypothetical protein